MRTCGRCKETKPFSEFGKDSTRKGGLQRRCKKCRIEAQAEYRATEKGRAVQPRYRRSAKGQLSTEMYARRRAELIFRATPPWANLDMIKWFYDEADRRTKDTGIVHQVHHVVPLMQVGSHVCGLHVHTNLEILTEEEHKEVHRLLNFSAKVTFDD